MSEWNQIFNYGVELNASLILVDIDGFFAFFFLLFALPVRAFDKLTNVLELTLRID